MSKEANSSLGFYTPPVFLGNTLLHVILNYSENWFGNRKLTLLLLAMCVWTRRCSPPLNQLRLGKRCTRETIPPLKSKAKERWS